MTESEANEVANESPLIVHIDGRATFELGLVVLFQVAFLVLYSAFLNPNYAYYGFTMTIDPVKIIESFVLVTGSYLVLPRTESGVAELSLRVLYVLAILPVYALYAVADGPRTFVYVLSVGLALTCVIVRYPTRNYLQLTRETLGNVSVRTNAAFYLLLSGLTITTFSLIVYFNGLPSILALDLSNVYVVRRDFVYGTSVGIYLLTWQGKVVNMLFVGLGWMRRRASLVALGFGLQFVLFLYTGHKLLLFAPFFLLFVLYSVERDRFLSGFLRLFLATSLAMFGLFLVTGAKLPAYIFIGRTYFLTAQIQFNYHDFFTTHQFVHLTNSKVAFFLEDHYSMPIPRVIGKAYYADQTFANAGYMGNAFAHFGYVGIIAFSTVLGVILKGLNWIQDRVPLSLAISATLIPIYSLTQAGLNTVLLTHGLIPAAGLLLLYVRDEPAKGKGQESHDPSL